MALNGNSNFSFVRAEQNRSGNKMTHASDKVKVHRSALFTLGGDDDIVAKEELESASQTDLDDPFEDDDLDHQSVPWHQQVNIPYIEKDSLRYDFVMGCIFSLVFTAVLLVVCCLFGQCCDGMCCFDSQSPHQWNQRLRTRKRYKLGEGNGFLSYFGFGQQQEDDTYRNPKIDLRREKRSLIAASASIDSWDTTDDEYVPLAPPEINYQDDDDDDDEESDIDRLEYGESVGDYDDSVDYNLVDNRNGRYEQDQIEAAAKTYFDHERVQNFFTDDHTVDDDTEYDSDSSDPPLDLEMIEKKLVKSINHANASNRKY